MKQCSNVTPKSPPKFLRNLGGLTGRATNRGFTIIELLVVISIIVILTGIVLVGYRTGEQQFALQRSANKLAQDIRKVQEMAMSAREFCLTPPCPPNPKIVPMGGYGIYFEKEASQIRYYLIYADHDGDEKYDNGEEIETMYLDKGVEIQSVQPANRVSVNFKPPDPIIKLKDQAGNDKTNLAVTIALEADPLKTKTILINRAGRIDID